ncbi:MAG: oligosaccharide flippase family protein [Bacilli bacterium]|nr:oligosaccharide flippase family protein [Bacilli bacterium]
MSAPTFRHNDLRVNVVINLIRTLTMTVLSFITFPYVTRALGDEVFGLYTWANTFVYYFLVLARISIPNIAIRECSKVKDDREALSHKAQEFFLIQAVTTLLSFALECALCFSVPALKENNALIFLLSINFLVGVFSFEWIYIALEKHLYITIRSIMLIAISALMIYTFIRPTASAASAMNEVYIYALLTISSTVMTVIVNLLVLPKYISFKKTRPYRFLPLIKPLTTLLFISMFVTAYNQTDSFILGFIGPSKAAVGSYSVGVKGIDIIITLTTSLYAVFMPRATYYYGKEDKRFYRNLLRFSFNITIFIAIPAIATMATMSGPIVSLIAGSNNASYVGSNLVLTVLATMMLTFSIADNIYTQILLPQKREKVYLFAMLFGVILNIGLSLLFGLVVFKENPVFGVAIATMAADALILIFLLVMTREYSLPATFNLNTLKIVLVGVLVGVTSYFLTPLFIKILPFDGDRLWVAELLALLIVISIDAVIYIGGLLVCKENLVTSFLPASRRRREQENG